MRIVAFRVDGLPRGKQRPGFDSRKQGKRGYTPAQTSGYEDEVQTAWTQAGRVDLGDGPIGGVITAVHKRPRDHYTAAGTLTAKGEREPVPIRKPDADNVLKIVLDALHCPVKQGRIAFTDDTQITRVRFERRWARDGELEHTAVRLWSIDAAEPAAQGDRADVDQAVQLAAAIAAARGMPTDAVQLAELVLSLHDARMDGGPDPYAPANAAQAAALLETVTANRSSLVVLSTRDEGHLRVANNARAHGGSVDIAPDGTVVVEYAAITR